MPRVRPAPRRPRPVARRRAARQARPGLHRRCLAVAGGRATALFEQSRRDGLLRAVKCEPAELLAEGWCPLPAERQLLSAAFVDGRPMPIADAVRRAPDLAARLHARSLLVLPLATASERLGVITVGFDSRPKVSDLDVAAVADACRMTLEVDRLRRSRENQQVVQALIGEVTAGVGLSLTPLHGMDALAVAAGKLFGARSTSVWMLDRRSRELVLRATTSANGPAGERRVPVGDPQAPASRAFDQQRAEVWRRQPDDPTGALRVPLRGRRRALGAMLFDEVPLAPGADEAALDRADELARQLSDTLDTLQLVDEVRQSRQELENAFDSIAHLVVVADCRGRIVHANEAFAVRAQQTRDQLVNRPVRELVGRDLSGWLAALDCGDPARGHLPATRELVDPVLGGPFVVTVTALFDSQRTRTGTVIVARDVTRQSRLEAEREELHRRLGQSEKLAALGRFVAGVAHELNNPLQAVLGHLELLRVTGRFPKAIRHDALLIQREADRAAKIVRNLLVFAGSRRIARRPVSVNAVLKKVVSLRTRPCRALGVELVRHYDSRLPRVPGDPLLLHQAFLNVLMNAEHAIARAGGGRIEIATAGSASRDRAIVTFRDTGPGIPPDVLPRVFEPFFTTKDVGQGTGLGLAIAYGVVQEHGGSIAAANHPAGGAVFTIELGAAPAGGHADDD